MNDFEEMRVRVDMERPARNYRELSQQILLLASGTESTRTFIYDVMKLLCYFTACDELEIWIRRGKRRMVGWTYEQSVDGLRNLGNREIDKETRDSADAKSMRNDQYASMMKLTLRFGAEIWGWIELRSNLGDFFGSAKRRLYEDIALTLGVAVAYQSAQRAQRERVKELSCLYQIARISADRSISTEQLFSGLVSTLPPALLHPDVAAACISLDEHRYTTEGFQRVVQKLSFPVVVADQERGRVTVGYTEDRPTIDDGPFLEEEQNLIEVVAREIGQMWEQRQAANDRQRLQEQLRHADRLATIGQLAAGVAHELNEPLGSILGFAQLAGKAPELSEQVSRDLSRIASAALHSREIVRKLSLFARQSPARREKINLSVLVEDGLFLLEERCRKEGIKLELDLAESLPGIDGDSGQLTQVLMNLMVNAIQSMPDGGELCITTSHRTGWVSLSVSDTGCGIPPEEMPRIFEPFFTTKDVGEGTGLGLSVVHGIVAAHGGKIHTESKLGMGTNIFVDFPALEFANGESQI